MLAGSGGGRWENSASVFLAFLPYGFVRTECVCTRCSPLLSPFSIGYGCVLRGKGENRCLLFAVPTGGEKPRPGQATSACKVRRFICHHGCSPSSLERDPPNLPKITRYLVVVHTSYITRTLHKWRFSSISLILILTNLTTSLP